MSEASKLSFDSMSKIQSPKSSKSIESEPTSNLELWAWWIYNFAIEPMVLNGLTLFMPLLIDSLAKAVGHSKKFPNLPCNAELKDSDDTCILFNVGKLEINTASFTYLSIAVSVFLQALTFMSLGSMADYGRLRRRFLRISTWLGSLFSILFLFISNPSNYWIAAVLYILTNICVGTATVFYNAYLPLLSKNHHSCLSGEKNQEELSNWISTKGFIIGYISVLITLSSCGLYLFLSGKESYTHCIAFHGLWWAIISIFPLLKLKVRAGPSLPRGTNYFFLSWKNLFETLKKTRKLPNTFWYLISYFLFSDGFATLANVSVVFARDELNVESHQLLFATLCASFCSIIGNFSFFKVQKSFNLSSKTMITIVLFFLSLVPLYGFAGLFTPHFGLRQKWEIYLFAVYYGFCAGALQSFSRVIFSELIPPGDESEFFSLYAITDKGSAALGPTIQSLVTGWSGNQRYGLLVLSLFFIIPIPIIILLVSPTKGKLDANSFYSTSLSQNVEMEEVIKK